MTFAGVPNSFVNGTTADAPSVNADFDAVTTGLNNIDAGQVTTGTLPIARGGTGGSTAPTALTALLAGSTVPVANGGTGAATAPAALTNLLVGSTIPGANGGFAVLLQTINASSGATIDFTGIGGTYKKYVALMHDVLPATDSVYLAMRVGTGAGPTWQAGVGAYAYGYRISGVSGGADGGSGAGLDNETTSIHLSRPSNGISNTGGGVFAVVEVPNPAGGILEKVIMYRAGYLQTGAVLPAIIYGGGVFGSNTAITGLRFFMSSGNVASGVFELWGVN